MPKCSIEHCTRQSLKRGWCNRHYLRWWTYGDPLFSKTAGKGDLREWILQHRSFSNDECLIWPFGTISSGYAQLRWEGETIRANRLMCALRHGPPPTSKHEAAHNCGNERCVNPDHLRWATPTENQNDRVIHGTSNRGRRQWLAKLDEDKVREIRSSSDSNKELALRFGVSAATIREVRVGRNWAWVE